MKLRVFQRLAALVRAEAPGGSSKAYRRPSAKTKASAGLRGPAMALGALAILAGCAAVPDLPAADQIKKPGELQSAATLAAPATNWPANGWWQRYGDPQLDALIDEALANSPTLAMAKARLAGAQAMSEIASAALEPQVNANIGAADGKLSYNFLTPRPATPQGWNKYGLAALDLSWEVDFWGKNHAALAAATSEQLASAVEVDQARLMLSTSVAFAYAELSHLYALQDTAQEAVDIRGRTADLMRQRHDEELEPLVTVREAEANAAAAQAELQAVDERIALQKNALAALLGAGPDRGLTIARPSAQVTAIFGLPADLSSDLIARRPDIVAARLRVEAAAHAIDQSKAAFYPSVNLLGVGGLLSFGLNNWAKAQSSFGAVGPAISLPIFNTERLKGQLRGAHAEYNAAVDGYNATLVNALHEVADTVTSRRALQDELVSLQASVDSVQQAYQLVNSRYRAGLATYLDVLTVEDTLVSAQRELANVQSRTLGLDVALVRAMGGGFDARPIQSQLK